MEIETKIQVYALNGVNTSGESVSLLVKNVPSNPAMIVIEIDGKKAKVYGPDLQRAIQNAID